MEFDTEPSEVAAPDAKFPTSLGMRWTLECWPAVDRADLRSDTLVGSEELVDRVTWDADGWTGIRTGGMDGPGTVGSLGGVAVEELFESRPQP